MLSRPEPEQGSSLVRFSFLITNSYSCTIKTTLCTLDGHTKVSPGRKACVMLMNQEYKAQELVFFFYLSGYCEFTWILPSSFMCGEEKD